MNLVEHVLERNRLLPVPPSDVLDPTFQKSLDRDPFHRCLVGDLNGKGPGGYAPLHKTTQYLPGPARTPRQNGIHGRPLG